MRQVRAMVTPLAVLVAMGLLSGCGADGSRKPSLNNDSPRTLLEAANLHGVHSGDTQAVFKLVHDGKDAVTYIKLSGEFAQAGERALPQFRISGNSKNVRNRKVTEVNARLFVLPSEAVLVYGPALGEKAYKPDTPTFKDFATKVVRSQEESGPGNLSACLNAAEGLELPSLVRNLEVEGHLQESDGTNVILVGGDVDVAGFRAALNDLSENPSCAAQMEAFGLPLASALEAAEAGRVEATAATLGVGDDGIFRSLLVRVDFKEPNGEQVELTLSGSLWNVNGEVQVVGSPTGLPLGALLAKFGVSLDRALRASGDEIVLGVIEAFGGSLTGRMGQVVFPART